MSDNPTTRIVQPWPPTEVRFTELKQMRKSPAHFKASFTDPKGPAASGRFGILTHAILLGGKVVVYEGERRGNAWKAFKADNEGAFIVTDSEATAANRVADKVRSHPIAGPLLEGMHEKELKWTNAGVPCGTRIDTLGDYFINDLKTSSYTEPDFMGRSAFRMVYHAQAAWHRDAAAANGFRIRDSYITCVETDPPFAITVMRLTDRALEEGRKLTRLWLERYRTCRDANEWPEYVQSIIDLDIDQDSELDFGDGEAA